jgi:hypothetical protein
VSWFSQSSDPRKSGDQQQMRMIAGQLMADTGTRDSQLGLASQLTGRNPYEGGQMDAAGKLGDLAGQIAAGGGMDRASIGAETTANMRSLMGQMAGRGVGLGSGATGAAVAGLSAAALQRRAQMDLARKQAAAQLHGQRAGVLGQLDQSRTQRLGQAAGIYGNIDQSQISRMTSAGQLLANTGETPKSNGAKLGEGFAGLISNLAGPAATLLSGLPIFGGRR